jgi:hypothetical protein
VWMHMKTTKRKKKQGSTNKRGSVAFNCSYSPLFRFRFLSVQFRIKSIHP